MNPKNISVVVRTAADPGQRSNRRQIDLSGRFAVEGKQPQRVAGVVHVGGDEGLMDDGGRREFVARSPARAPPAVAAIAAASIAMMRPRGAPASVRNSSRSPADSMKA